MLCWRGIILSTVCVHFVMLCWVWAIWYQQGAKSSSEKYLKPCYLKNRLHTLLFLFSIIVSWDAYFLPQTFSGVFFEIWSRLPCCQNHAPHNSQCISLSFSFHWSDASRHIISIDQLGKIRFPLPYEMEAVSGKYDWGYVKKTWQIKVHAIKKLKNVTSYSIINA